jgi:hypothetical protein
MEASGPSQKSLDVIAARPRITKGKSDASWSYIVKQEGLEISVRVDLMMTRVGRA